MNPEKTKEGTVGIVSLNGDSRERMQTLILSGFIVSLWFISSGSAE